MSWKELVRNYFRFTRKDRIAIILITILLALVISYPAIHRHFESGDRPLTDTSWIAAIKVLETPSNTPQPNYPANNNQRRERFVESSRLNLFPFDPNTLDQAGWKRLGLRDKTIQTILKYRSKGGRFRYPEDLQRVYGLRQEDYAQLSPYIRIEQSVIPEVKQFPSKKPFRDPIDINAADTAAFIDLPGIGNKLAQRIVNFRERLGGFYSVMQVGETFGLADSVFQKIRPLLKLENNATRKLSINSATVEELKTHPYIRYQLANAIVAYRRQHGNFKSIEEIKNIQAITADIFEKLEPYLKPD